jgi:hypothetical protein
MINLFNCGGQETNCCMCLSPLRVALREMKFVSTLTIPCLSLERVRGLPPTDSAAFES